MKYTWTIRKKRQRAIQRYLTLCVESSTAWDRCTFSVMPTSTTSFFMIFYWHPWSFAIEEERQSGRRVFGLSRRRGTVLFFGLTSIQHLISSQQCKKLPQGSLSAYIMYAGSSMVPLMTLRENHPRSIVTGI